MIFPVTVLTNTQEAENLLTPLFHGNYAQFQEVGLTLSTLKTQMVQDSQTLLKKHLNTLAV